VQAAGDGQTGRAGTDDDDARASVAGQMPT
jgi:hypothetical protein